MATRQRPRARRKVGPIKSIHHLAFRCRNAEETRAFYEDLMELRLAAALDFYDGAVNPMPFATAPKRSPFKFLHLFFEMGDGNYMAFFEVPASAPAKLFGRQWGMDRHVAFEVSTKREASAIQRRWRSAGVKTWGPTEHGFVRSVYAFDPNGIQVEVTYKTPAYAAIMRRERDTAREVLALWAKETRRGRGASKAVR